jgi:hypothetical protein
MSDHPVTRLQKERMRPAVRYRRTLLVTALSLGVFVWCFASGVRSEGDRKMADLHAGHRSGTFRAALAQLNARLPQGQRLDECSACHDRQAWVPNLVSATPVLESRCGQCHEAQPAGADAEEPGTSAVGVPWLGARLGRPAHQGIDFLGGTTGTNVAGGMRVPGNGRLECAECHPDHEQDGQLVDPSPIAGASQPPGTHAPARSPAKVPVERVKGEDGTIQREITRYRFTDLCAGCHLPTRPSPEATAVLKEFLTAHHGGNGLSDPELPPEAVQAVRSAPDGKALDSKTQRAFVDQVLRTLQGQTITSKKRKWKEEGLRGCTPACHGEHAPGLNDAGPEQYAPAGSTGRAEGNGGRWGPWRLAGVFR